MAASAMSSIILGKYLDKELAKALCEPKLILAPKKSTSSINASFEIVLEPLPKRLPVSVETPAFSPSSTGGLSILNWIDTRGSLWFSTTKTLSPFLSSKRCGSCRFILGEGPGLGIILLSTCACMVKAAKAKTSVIYNFFIFSFSFLLFLPVSNRELPFG